MTPERIVGEACDPPFPVHAHLADDLAAAHHDGNGERDATVAHVLAASAAYPYSDVADHGPHHYLSALRPSGRVTEFGDRH